MTFSDSQLLDSTNCMASQVFLTLLFIVKVNIHSIFVNCFAFCLFPLGYYLYMDASNLKPKDTARVSYHFSSVSQSYCQINFFYYMFGAGLGALRLKVEPKGEQSKEVLYSFFIHIQVLHTCRPSWVCYHGSVLSKSVWSVECCKSLQDSSFLLNLGSNHCWCLSLAIGLALVFC